MVERRVLLRDVGSRNLVSADHDTIALSNGSWLNNMDTMEEDNPFSKSQTVHPEVRAYVYSLVNAVCLSSSLNCL